MTTYTVQRIEWVPVKAEYRIEADSPQEAIGLLERIDDVNLPDKETQKEIDLATKIMGTRNITKVIEDAEAILESDEVSCWTVDGKTLNELNKDEELNQEGDTK